LLYACGVSWLKLVTGLTWVKAMAAGMLPFLIGDALKIAAAVPIARTLRPVIQSGAAGEQPARVKPAGTAGSNS
jgi:biotin transport system substrate-specific component